MKLLSLFVCAWLLLVPVSAQANPYEFDLVGIKFGMSGAEARAIVEKTGKPYNFADFKMDGKTVGFNALIMDKDKPNRVVDQVIVMFSEENGVWYVGRGQRYADDAQPDRMTMIESLEKKFGRWNSPTSSTLNNWSFDRQGQPLSGAKAGACHDLSSTGSGQIIRPAATQIRVPSTFNNDCGVCVTAFFSGPGDSIGAYSVAIIDGKTRYDEIEARENAKQPEPSKKSDVTPDL